MLPPKRTQQITWTLLAFLPIIGMAVDLVAPSLPAIASGLQIHAKLAKDVISIYLLGYALGNFIVGLLTDAWGRKWLLRVTLGGFILCSLLPIFMPSIGALLTARLLQGLMLGAIAVLSRSILADISAPEKLLRLGPLIGMMWGIGPVIGPVLGGYLQFYIGWQAGFYFFASVGIVTFIVVLMLIPETHTQRQALRLATLKQNITEVLSHRLFMALVFLMGLVYSLIICFNTAAPFLIQAEFHYSSVFFGHLALGLGAMFLMATFVCRYLLKKFCAEALFTTVIHVFFGLAIIGLLLSYGLNQSVVLLSLTSAAMFFACGFLFPLSIGKGISLFRHISGTAAAVMYLVNVSMTSLSAYLIGFLHMQTITPLLWIYFLLLLLCVAVYWGMFRRGASDAVVEN